MEAECKSRPAAKYKVAFYLPWCLWFQSEGSRKRRQMVKEGLKSLIEKKGKVQTLNYLKTWSDLKESSDLMVTRDMYEDALKDLSDDGVITLTGRTTIRVNLVQNWGTQTH